MYIRDKVYTGLGRSGLVVALRLWEGWTYSANPITSWKESLVLQRGVVYAVEICRIKGVEANFGQIHVVETEHHHLDGSILFQALRIACFCPKTVGSPRVLGSEARKARGKAEVQHEDRCLSAFQSLSEVAEPVASPVQRLPKTAEILLLDCKLIGRGD